MTLINIPDSFRIGDPHEGCKRQMQINEQALRELLKVRRVIRRFEGVEVVLDITDIFLTPEGYTVYVR